MPWLNTVLGSDLAKSFVEVSLPLDICHGYKTAISPPSILRSTLALICGH